VVEFWKRRDPTPESESNELRDRFESRVAFADSAFSTESVRGAVSDRGRVFILLGKPRIVRNLPLTRAEGATIPRASTVVADGTVERWVFFAEQVPAGVPKREVSFSFITQIGYGDNVMQRDFFAIEALDAAAKTMRVR
jgi:GWxTD domain-containing protein